ncbi:MAG: DUF2946 family protein [Burkholderiaceae bacterium]
MIALTLFVMALGVMILAPLLRPATLERICSVQGSRFVDLSGTGSAEGAGHIGHGDASAHCPLCMPAGLVPDAIVWDFKPLQPLAFVRQGIPAARLASLVGAPLPARGPPLLT